MSAALPFGLVAAVFALSACPGKEVLDLGGDVGQVTLEGGGPGADAATDGSSGDSSGGSSGGSGGDGNDGGFSVPGNTFPCGLSVCSAPNVCCVSPSARVCEAIALCNDIAVGCTATTCPMGSGCCASILGADSAHPTGSTQCVVGTLCPVGMQATCDTGVNASCPAGYDCFGNLVAVCLGPFDGGGE